MEFKRGDKVTSIDGVYRGHKGIITDISLDDGVRRYFVRFENGEAHWKHETNLTLFETSLFKLIPGKHIVKTRDGDLYLLVEGTNAELAGIEIGTTCGWTNFKLDENLEDKDYSDYDIMEIFEFEADSYETVTNNLKSVWKREEFKEMTIAEIEKELGYKVKIVKE